MTTYVVDANVIVASFIPEEHSEIAELLIGRHRRRDIDLIAPQQVLAEVGHALRRELVRKRIPADVVPSMWADFRSLPLRLVGLDVIADAAFDLSLANMASFYDSLYVALSIHEKVPFVTTDERAKRAFNGAYDIVHITEIAV